MYSLVGVHKAVHLVIFSPWVLSVRCSFTVGTTCVSLALLFCCLGLCFSRLFVGLASSGTSYVDFIVFWGWDSRR